MNLFSIEKKSTEKMLLIGFSVIIITGTIGHFSGVSNDGVLDIHLRKHSVIFGLCISIISWVLISLFAWIVGKIFSKSKIRIIDVAGMMAYARTPFLIAILAGFLLPQGGFQTGNSSFFIIYTVFTLFAITITIVSVYLIWKAFSIACNLTKTKGAVLFILVVLLAETASFGANYLLSKKIDKVDILAIENRYKKAETED